MNSGSGVWGLLRRRRDYRRLWVAHAVSRAGDAFNSVAIVVLAFRLTGSGVGVAGVVAFEVVPVVFLGPVAGLVADRFPRPRVMVGADLARAGCATVLAVAHGSVIVTYASAFGLATGSLFFNPAAASLVPDLVSDDEVVVANAGLWTVAVVAQIVLAPAAGVTISVFGPGVAFALNAASFGLSAVVLRGLPTGPPRRPGRGEGHWAAIIAGVAAVRGHPLLARLAVVQLLAALSAGATSALLVVLARQSLGLDASGFGLLVAAIGVGAATGPLLLARRIRPARRPWLFGPYVLRGAVDLTLAATTSSVTTLAALFVYGIATSTGMIAYSTTVQTVVPGEVRGRVFAVYDVVWQGARLVSLGGGAVVADAFGVRSVYVAGAVLMLAAGGVGLIGRLTRGPPDAP